MPTKNQEIRDAAALLSCPCSCSCCSCAKDLAIIMVKKKKDIMIMGIFMILRVVFVGVARPTPALSAAGLSMCKGDR